VQETVRNSHADYLLYVIVDCPTMKWLKVTAACYDASGQQIWMEESCAGKGLLRQLEEQDTLKRLYQKLDERLGQPGMFQANLASHPPVATVPNPMPVSEQAAPISAAQSPASKRDAHRREWWGGQY
jgi:hypothetical protein